MRSNPISEVQLKARSFFNSIKRRLFFRNKKKRSSSKSLQVNQRSLSVKLQRVKNILQARTILLVCTVLLGFVLVLNLNQYFTVKVHTYGEADYSPELISAQDSNVLFVGYEEDEDDYRYINFLYFVNSQDGVLRGFAIDPSYVLRLSGGYVQMSTLLSAFEENVMESTVTRLEYELGIRVDRYIAFDSIRLGGYLTDSYSQTLGNLFKEGLYDEEVGFASKASTQHEFISKFFSSYSSIREKLYNFWKVDNIADIIQTNYSKREFINFLLIFDSDLKAKIELAPEYGVLDTNGYYRVNTLLFDEALNATFRDLRIVAEQCEVEVYNSSVISGLASQKSRELQIAGANVVKYGNYFEDVEEKDVKGLVYVNTSDDLEKYQYTIQLIKQSLRGDIIIRVGEYEYNQTGDLILVLL